MKKFDLKPVKDIAELVLGSVAYVLIAAATAKMVNQFADSCIDEIAEYDDAVNAIMKSGMFSHDKATAVTALKRNGNSAFYKAIVHIAEDDSMFSHDKANMIKELSQN
jgi:2-hydroxy-3-keto-5-methylthiopentenyl-1-phosphate phosphatase